MRATVTTAFPGVEDGKIYPRDIAEGEIISGDLAAAAVEAGWAEEIDEAKFAREAKKRADEAAAAAAKASRDAAEKRLKDLREIAQGAKVDLGKAKTAEEIEAALKAAGVTIPGL